MRIAFGFGELMMHAVRRDPFRRVVLNSHRAEDRQRVFEPLRRFKAPVRQKPVIAEPDAEAVKRQDDMRQFYAKNPLSKGKNRP